MGEVATRGAGAVVRRTPAQELIAVVRSDEFREQLAMALPENVPASRFARAVSTALLNDPSLADDMHFDSFVVALMRSAQAGLLPDGREAAIVKYRDNKANCNKAQFLPMIGGIRKNAGEFGWTIDTKVVREHDQFDYELGMEPRLTHKPALGDRGALRFAYAIARHRDGRREIEVMDDDEIAKVRKASRASSRGPWVDWEERMWEKSVGHRIFKRLPLDPGDKRVAVIVDAELVGPEAAANMLYGPTDAPLGRVREIEAPKDSPQGAGDGGPEASAGQQGAEGEAGSGDEPGADGTPSAAPGFQIPDAVIEAAGKVMVQEGWTVAETCADKSGTDYVRWALGSDYDNSLDEAVVAAMRTYATAKHPELLEVQP